MKKIIIVLLIFATQVSSAQDSTGLKLSLLTCAPGDQLYSIFGHSALRVQNEQTGKDEVYNYGMFSFRQPNFYTKFVRGKLSYWLGKTSFERFLYEYQHEGRAVVENELMLTGDEKIKLLAFLNLNMKKENRFYSYDFFFDNCSTRIRDALESVLGEKLTWNSDSEQLPSYRDLLDIYLANSPWNDFGIDLILGKPTDDDADVRQQMFLPDFLKENMSSGKVKRGEINSSLMSPTLRLIDFPHVMAKVPFYKRPWFLLTLLLALMVFLVIRNPVAKGLKVFDFLFLLITGIAGCLFLFMWFGTDHQACYQNWNMLWAFPLSLIAAFFAFSKSELIDKYKLFVGGLLLLTLLGWFFWPQQFSPSFLPIIGLGLLVAFRQLLIPKKLA